MSSLEIISTALRLAEDFMNKHEDSLALNIYLLEHGIEVIESTVITSGRYDKWCEHAQAQEVYNSGL